jgi:hypothetical protein
MRNAQNIGIFRKFNKILLYCLIVSLLVLFSYPQAAKAAPSMTAISDTTSRLKVSENSSHVIKFTTGDAIATGPGDHITITFPSDFDFTAKAINTLTFTHGAGTGLEITETLAGTATASDWGAEFSGTENRILTLTVPTDGVGAGAVAAGNKLIITYDNTNAANASTANNYVVTIAVAGSTTESGSYAIPIITDDQVVVSTTIDPYVTFTLTNNTVSLITSTDTNPNSANTGFNKAPANTNTIEAYTNAGSGYSITYYGDTLKTAGGAHSIDAMAVKAVSATNTEQFGLNLKLNTTPATGANKSGSGGGASEADYDTANQYKYVANTTTALAAAAAATASNIFTVTYIVNVTQTTDAGVYSTTLTYICTGNF